MSEKTGAAKEFVMKNMPLLLAGVELVLVLLNYSLIVQTDESVPAFEYAGTWTTFVTLGLLLTTLRALLTILGWCNINLTSSSRAYVLNFVVVILLFFGTMDVWNEIRTQNEKVRGWERCAAHCMFLKTSSLTCPWLPALALSSWRHTWDALPLPLLATALGRLAKLCDSSTTARKILLYPFTIRKGQ